MQSHILYQIRSLNNPSMQQVADELGMDISTFSRQIKTLETRKNDGEKAGRRNLRAGDTQPPYVCGPSQFLEMVDLDRNQKERRI